MMTAAASQADTEERLIERNAVDTELVEPKVCFSRLKHRPTSLDL